jgi:predicted Zn-dependent protease
MPDKKQTKLRADFDEAVKAQESGDLARARLLLTELHERAPDSVLILLTLAHTCWELSHLHEALELFRRATVLEPECEAASLGLFHLLWKVDRIDEAFDEMRRYLLEYESEEYTKLLTNLKKPKITRH